MMLTYVRYIDVYLYKMDHTLTILSHPHDTMIGLAVFGENRTHEAQSVWPSSWKSLDTKAQFLRIFDEI